MLIAVSGSQGSGKSTLLNAIKFNFNYSVIERKTSRSILNDWNVTLQEINNNPKLTTEFQHEITKRKHFDETNIDNKNIWFTERTNSDLFTYSLMNLGNNNEYSDWINDYYNTCLIYNKIYDHVIYLTAGHFDIEHDGIRGSNKHYSTMIDCCMLNFTKQMIPPEKLTIIDIADINTRIDIIQKIITDKRNNND